MTKKSVRGEFNTFVKGLITEASPLNFPEQAAKDIVNFELNRDGTLYRRLGFGLEPSFQYRSTTATTADDIVKYVWEEPASLPKNKFLAVVASGSVKVYDLSEQSITGDGYLGEVVISATIGTITKNSLSSVDGRLVITTGSPDIVVIDYNPNTGTFSQSSFRISTRDIWGVYVEESANYPSWRPTTNNDLHRYNLYNAGWAVQRQVSFSTTNDPAKETFAVLGFYPAETDPVWAGMTTMSNSGVPAELFRTDTLSQTFNTQAAPLFGHFVIDLLDRGSSREDAVTASAAQNPYQEYLNTSLLPTDVTEKGATVICEHAGRAFYAGFGPTVTGDKRSPDLTSFIAFSRLVRNVSDLQKCYQDGDPTSREANDIVDTDGGLIRISGAVGISGLYSLGRNLVVCASNGVWSIEGGSDYGFTATNYKVNRVTDFGVASGSSVVTDGSVIYYWGDTGIYVISRNEFGDLVVKSLTETTIESFYQAVTEKARSSAKGAYDKVEKKVRWVFPETEWNDFTSSTVELVLDLSLGSFYINKIPPLLNRKILDVFTTPAFSLALEETSVSSGSDAVLAGTDSVVVNVPVSRTGSQSLKYLVAYSNAGLVSYTVGWYSDQNFVDWYDVNSVGVDSKGYLLTGAITSGDSAIHKQTPVLVVHMERTEDALDSEFNLSKQSGCLTRVIWDFASSTVSNKFSPLFQVYRLKRVYIPSTPGPFDNGFELMTSRNKLRGRGRALSIYMETEAGKDCRLVGWNLSMNGNAVA